MKDEAARRLGDLIEDVEESSISSIQSVVTGIVKIINDPKSTAKDLKDVIQIDPPLTAKVLRLANSAYYGSPQKIREIEQAVIWIGFDALKELALSQKVCEVFNRDVDYKNYSRTQLWKHSVATAHFAKMIYRKEFGLRGDDVYAAGLLHDIGIIIEDQFMQPDFVKLLKAGEKGDGRITDAETELFGFHHGDIGEKIMDRWSFPPGIIVAIANHHNPTTVLPEYSLMANTLFIADAMVQRNEIGYTTFKAPGEHEVRTAAERIKINMETVNIILEELQEKIAQMEEQGVLFL